MSIALSPENTKLVIGHVDGTILTRLKQSTKAEAGILGDEDDDEEGDMKASASKRFYKGQCYMCLSPSL